MNLTSWKSLLGGVFIAPLITIPITFICSVIYIPFSQGSSFDFEGVLLLAIFGMVIFSYPATLILGLSIYFCSKNKLIGSSPWIYITPAFILTAAIADIELLDKKGHLGLTYLSSAIGCSWLFWFISIHWPNRVNQKIKSGEDH
ncbi:hypothetical protein [Pseudoalteromonas sp. A601]|uniref:hypothetical protein n=1 Tax=Pseudoalteromonas sp. A601 TaxID=1967839 RepID=UPI00111CA09D|nr:hypothetical protein [Pseudoalteromonas sp. A601]